MLFSLAPPLPITWGLWYKTMPFKSKAQMRKFASLVKAGKITQKTFVEWANNTESVSGLPERLKQKNKKAKGIKKIREIK